MKEFADKCVHTFMVIISFSYLFVITKASEIFDCSYIKEGNYYIMNADTTVKCYQGIWWAYFPFSIGLVILFGLGTLAVFLYISLNRKKIITDKVFNDRFRFLFIRFRNQRGWWEAMIVIRKLLISIAIIFFAGYPMLVILFAMFVIFCSFILQTHHVPFRRVFHNIMEYVQLLSTEFLLFSALLFYVNAFPDQWNKEALGFIVIIVVVFCSALMAALILLDIFSQVRRDYKLNKERKLKNAAVVNVVSNNEDDEGDQELKDVELKDVDHVTIGLPPVTDDAPSPISPTESTYSLKSPQSPDGLLTSRQQSTATPSFVLKVQQRLPKPHPKVAKYSSLAWNRFTKFLDRIEGDGSDFEVDWNKIQAKLREEEKERKEKEEAELLEKMQKKALLSKENVEKESPIVTAVEVQDVELKEVQVNAKEEEIEIEEFHDNL